jgi:ubiquinone/menaquinone biosynthesis C-methylase UbiE
VSGVDPETQRAEMLARWEGAAAGWGRRAGRVRDLGMAVSSWMIEQLALAPGQRVLELAAGPGDSGFLAAELIAPGGVLICSDAAEAMLEIARERARELGIGNVEFKRLELEWIDLPTASVDAILCRWGLMLTLDPGAAAQEARRVLRPGGRIAVAVWDKAPRNPWATIWTQALIELGHASPPDPNAPGMFALASADRLAELFEGAGFLEVRVEAIEFDRVYEDVDAYVEETLDLSPNFSGTFGSMSGREQARVRGRIAELLAQFTAAGGMIRLPSRALGVAADA